MQTRRLTSVCVCEKMDSKMKEKTGRESVLDMSPTSMVGGGAEDIYGEDRATEDQLITPGLSLFPRTEVLC